MPSRYDYLELVKRIKRDLDTKHLGFKSYERTAITKMLREISGEPNTRIKTAYMAPEIEGIFAEQGLRVYPRLSDTNTGQWIRVWRAATLATELLDLIQNPGLNSDADLGKMATKIKGRWIFEPYDPDENGRGVTTRRRSAG